MSADTIHKYVAGLVALKTMTHMLPHELDKGEKIVYPDATDARVLFQKDITTECMDTIKDYQASHQFATIDHHEDVEELVFPLLSKY